MARTQEQLDRMRRAYADAGLIPPKGSSVYGAKGSPFDTSVGAFDPGLYEDQTPSQAMASVMAQHQAGTGSIPRLYKPIGDSVPADSGSENGAPGITVRHWDSYLEEAGSMPSSLIGTDYSAGKKESKFGDNLKGLGASIGQGLAAFSQARSNIAQNQYANAMGTWAGSSKLYADPTSDLMPDIEGYLAQMPSARDALTRGTMTHGLMTKNKALGAAFDPVGQGIEKMLGRDWNGAAEYTFGKIGERGLQGLAGGGLFGMIGGGIIGAVEGIFGWNDALSQDKATKAKALADYERVLKEWTVNRNKRIQQQQEIDNANMVRGIEERSRKKEVDSDKRAMKSEANRAQMMKVFRDSMSWHSDQLKNRLATIGA